VNVLHPRQWACGRKPSACGTLWLWPTRRAGAARAAAWLAEAAGRARRYVYQKAYVEFFCSPSSFRALEARLAARPSVTYMAVNAAGQSATNVPAGAARAPPPPRGAPCAPSVCPRVLGILRCIDAAFRFGLHALHVFCGGEWGWRQ